MIAEALMLAVSCVYVGDKSDKVFKSGDYVADTTFLPYKLNQVVSIEDGAITVHEVDYGDNVLDANGNISTGNSHVDMDNLLKHVPCLILKDGTIFNEGDTQLIKVGAKGFPSRIATAKMLFEGGYAAFYVPEYDHAYIRKVETKKPCAKFGRTCP